MHLNQLVSFGLLLLTSVAKATPVAQINHQIGVIPSHDSLIVRSAVTDNIALEKRSPAAIKQMVKAAAQHAIHRYATQGPYYTMFHSGIGEKRAVELSQRKGLTVVEIVMANAVSYEPHVFQDTLVKYCVPKAQFAGACAPESKTADWLAAWEGISEAWAEFAQGQTTTVISSRGVRADSFYNRIEKPILKHNRVRIQQEVDSGR